MRFGMPLHREPYLTTKPVSLRDAAELVSRVRRAFEQGVGDVRSNDTVCGLLAIAEQWVDEQSRSKLTSLTGNPSLHSVARQTPLGSPLSAISEQPGSTHTALIADGGVTLADDYN
jgi:hypothetical protein